MPLFLEPSAWVKLYVQEVGTETMKKLIARPDVIEDGLFASRAVALEMYGRLAKSLRRGEREIEEQLRGQESMSRRRVIARRIRRGHLRKYQAAVAEFDRDFRDGINKAEVTEEVQEQAIRFAHANPERSVSPMDWLHLATALQLSDRLRALGLPHNVVLVTSDGPLKAAAIAQGMEVFDPCTDDLDRLAPLSLGF